MVFLLAAAVILSAFPFYPLRRAEALSDGFADILSFAIEPPVFQTVLERCLLLLPLGYLGARVLEGRPARILLPGLILGALLIALGLEACQLPFAARHARYSDALIAFWSLLAGGVIGLVHGRTAKRLIRKAVLAGGAAIAILAGGGMAAASSTANWTCSFPTLAGDELGGGRPWRGAIAGIALYTVGLDEAAVRGLTQHPFALAEEPARKALGAVWIYSGEDAAGHPETPLELGRDTQTRAALPSEFCEAVRRGGAVTIELRIRPEARDQWGPARILSSSKSTLLRNFTLGQTGDAYDFRIRTRASGANGTYYVVRSAEGTVALRWQHVTATYANGTASLYIDGKRAAGPVHFASVFEADPQKAAPAFVLYLTLASGAAALIWLERRHLRNVFPWRRA